MQGPSPLQPVATWIPNGKLLFFISDLRHSLEKEGQKGIRPPILFPSAPCSSSQHCPLVPSLCDSILFTLSFTFALHLSVFPCCVAHPLSKYGLSLPVSLAGVLLHTKLMSSFSSSFLHSIFSLFFCPSPSSLSLFRSWPDSIFLHSYSMTNSSFAFSFPLFSPLLSSQG